MMMLLRFRYQAFPSLVDAADPGPWGLEEKAAGENLFAMVVGGLGVELATSLRSSAFIWLLLEKEVDEVEGEGPLEPDPLPPLLTEAVTPRVKST